MTDYNQMSEGSKTITCNRCGNDFEFTKGQQEWFAERNLSEPKKCQNCIKAARAERDGQRQNGSRDFRNNGNFRTSDKEAA